MSLIYSRLVSLSRYSSQLSNCPLNLPLGLQMEYIELMNKYTFPVISRIEDVLPHIEGRNEFKVMRKEGYNVVNYLVNLSSTFDWDQSDELGSVVRRECRGLIFDSVSGLLVSRPYHKFFNVGERAELSLDGVDMSLPHLILEKLDGSMIRPVPVQGKKAWRLGTKAGITDVAMNAETWIVGHSGYMEFIKDALSQDLTPIFEWCSRKNRVVVDYPEDRLVLTAVRHTSEGFYLPLSSLESFASKYSLDLVKVVSSGSNNLQELVSSIRAWDDGEGVVVRFDDGHMFKIKADAYIALHKGKDAISSEKNVVNVVVNDLLDDLVPVLNEQDSSRLRAFQGEFWKGVDKVANELVDEYLLEGVGFTEQKDFAQQFVSTLPAHLQPFMYGLRKNLNIRDLLISSILKGTSSQTKIDSSRWMWGGGTWNA